MIGCATTFRKCKRADSCLFFLLVFKVSLQNAISQNPKQANNPQNTKNQVAKSGLTATWPRTFFLSAAEVRRPSKHSLIQGWWQVVGF